MYQQLIKICQEKKCELEIIREGDTFYTRSDIDNNKLTIIIPERDDFVIDEKMIEDLLK